MSNNFKSVLAVLGIDMLRPEQEQALKPILNGQDVIISLRTDGGKFLLYQAPAFTDSQGEITLVFSPLIALQMAQVLSLRKKLTVSDAVGEEVIHLNSSMTAGERHKTLSQIQTDQVRLVYLAPEQLQNAEVRGVLRSATVRRVVVDEAHVLTQYAAGFRKAYGKIGEWISTLPSVPQILALSATVTVKDAKKIGKALGMNNADILRFPIRRENLKLVVRKMAMPKKCSFQEHYRIMNQAVERALNDWDREGSVLIYCPTVRDVKRLHKWLHARRWKVASYHVPWAAEKGQEGQNSGAVSQWKVPIVVFVPTPSGLSSTPDCRCLWTATYRRSAGQEETAKKRDVCCFTLCQTLQRTSGLSGTAPVKRLQTAQ